jgi:hypothetical protein
VLRRVRASVPGVLSYISDENTVLSVGGDRVSVNFNCRACDEEVVAAYYSRRSFVYPPRSQQPAVPGIDHFVCVVVFLQRRVAMAAAEVSVTARCPFCVLSVCVRWLHVCVLLGVRSVHRRLR